MQRDSIGVSVQSLEPRKLLSASIVDNILRIGGTGVDDTINVSYVPADASVPGSVNQLKVEVNSVPAALFPADVAGIRIDAGNGNDSITVAPEVLLDTTVLGGNGDDQITTGGGNDKIDGGNGADQIDAGDGDDSILGGNGHDELAGGGGDDLLEGGKGEDDLDGGDGNDTVHGGIGDDVVTDDDDDDDEVDDMARGTIVSGVLTVEGTHKNDDIEVTLVPADPNVVGSVAQLKLVFNAEAPELFAASTVTGIKISGGEGDDEIIVGSDVTVPATLLGGNGKDHLTGGAGNDLLDGANGKDELIGGAGADKLLGGNSKDHLDGGEGTDTLDGGHGKDHLVSDSTDSVLDEGKGKGKGKGKGHDKDGDDAADDDNGNGKGKDKNKDKGKGKKKGHNK